MPKLFAVLLLLCGLAAAQTSKVRSAASLPSTCNPGSANVSADVVSVSGRLNVCIATNTWKAATVTIASGTAAMGTGAISSGACATVVSSTATGALTTDVINASFNGDPTGVVGYQPSNNGMLAIIAYPTAGNVNFKVCNNTSGSVTPGAITLNWQVLR